MVNKAFQAVGTVILSTGFSLFLLLSTVEAAPWYGCCGKAIFEHIGDCLEKCGYSYPSHEYSGCATPCNPKYQETKCGAHFHNQGESLPEEQRKRVLCLIEKLSDPNSDDRAIMSWDSVAAAKTVTQGRMIIDRAHLRSIDGKDVKASMTEMCKQTDSKQVIAELSLFDNHIKNIIGRLNEWSVNKKTMPGQEVIKDWIAEQQRDVNSVYSCYAQR